MNKSTPYLASAWHPLQNQSTSNTARIAGDKGRRTGQAWSRMAVLWAVYFFAVFSLARYPEYQQAIIWSGGLCLAPVSLYLLLRQRTWFPLETLLLFALAGWSLGGFLGVQYPATYGAYLKLILEMAVVVWCVSAALKYSGGVRWFYWSFVAAGVFNVLAAGENLKIEPAELVHGETLRSAGINDNPNSLGFYCFLGMFGALALFGSARSWWKRGVLMAAAAICCYGLVASASRGPFLLTVLILLLWPVFCYRERLRAKWKVLLLLAAIVCGVILGGQWLIENTFMGYRVEQGLQREDSSSQARLNLASIGVRLFLGRPIFGIGLGQFPAASGTGAYAHNEWSELLATTGLVGFLLYMGVYATAWRRLSRALRGAKDSRLRYEINMARLIVVVLVVAGMLFRPNFLYVDTMFLIGIAAGTGQWARTCARQHSSKRTLAWMVLPEEELTGNGLGGPIPAPNRH